MRNLTVRLLLTVAAIAALGTAGFEAWRLEKDVRATDARRSHGEDRIRALMGNVGEARARQQAYVAAGQGSEFWAEKVAQVLATYDQDAAELRPTLAPTAQAALDGAGQAIDTFRKMDARAREYARSSQELLASDLIFTDGFETTATALSQLDAARVSELARADAETQGLRRIQLQWLAGGAAFCVFALMLLTPRAGGARVQEPDTDAVSATSTLSLAGPAKIAEPAPVPAGPDLTAAANVCADLARVLESAELTVLLARAAKVIDAAGLIVWVADRSGAELRPALAHGYSNQTLARMGSIARDAHNAVAAAYRAGSVRTVGGDGVTNGAVVAPIVSPGGCLGVLAAEIRHGGEHNVAVQALAMVFASQLGTLVSSVPADAGVSHTAQV